MNALEDEDLLAIRLPKRLPLPLVCLGSAALALAAGATVPGIDSQVALRIAVGLPLILLLLRYRYALLVAWIVVGALIGSTLPLISGNNIDTGLTIPTLLLLATVPLLGILRRVPALAVLLLYLLWVLAGIQSSPLGTAEFLKDWLLHVDYVAVALLAVSVVSTRRRLLLLVDAMLGVGAFVALYGIAGYFTQQNGVFDAQVGAFRILSIFASAPALALFLSVVIQLAIYRAFVSRGLVRVGALGTLVVLLVAVGLTFSRGAILSLSLSLAIVAFFLPSRRLRTGLLSGTVGLVGVAVILATVGGVPIFARFFGQDVASFNGRTYLWQALIARFDPRQILGNGLGAATAVLSKLNLGTGGISGNGLIATAPSNLYVGTLYDSGIVGLGLLLAALAGLGLMLIAGIRRTTGEHCLLFAVALLVLINMLIQSVEQDDLWTQGIALYFWIAVTLPFGACWFRAGPAAAAVDAPDLQAQEADLHSTPPEQPVGAHH